MTYEEFVAEIMAEAAECPKELRLGQSVYNITEERYHVGHKAMNLGVDCFYDDSKIDEFLQKAWEFCGDTILKK